MAKPGYLETLNDEQKSSLSALKDKISKETYEKVSNWGSCYFQLTNDRLLLKYLRARAFNVEKTFTMLMNTVEFRDKWQPQSMSSSDEEITAALNLGAWRLAGESLAGNPIQLIEIRKWDPQNAKSVETYTKNIIFQREKVAEYVANKKGWNPETSLVIFDMAEWSLFTHGTPTNIAFNRILVDISQNHYPELLEKALVINAPLAHRAIWNLIHPLLSSETVAKIQFVTDLKVLTEYIDPSMLYEKYGGTKKEEYPILLL